MEYKYDKKIDKEQLESLFSSVGWQSAKYPNRLQKAIENNDYVISVWDSNDLVGLLAALSDGYINVFLTYLLIKPEYQKQGLGTILVNDFLEKFKCFGRRIVTTELDKEKYYNKFGFKTDGICLTNRDWQNDDV